MTDFAPQPLSAPPTLADRSRWRLEVVLILAVGVLPPFVNSMLAFGASDGGGDAEVTRMHIAASVQSIAMLATMLFIAVRSGEPWARFGVARPRVLKDAGLLVALLATSWVLYYAYCIVVYNVAPAWYPAEGGAYQFIAPQSALERAAVFLSAGLNGTSEEVVLWALLFTRLESLAGGRRVLPIIVVSALFASYHLYQGVFAVGSIVIVGVVHGVVFAWTRRLLPLVVAHVVWDMQLLW